MIMTYMVEVGSKTRGPLTGYQVVKLFDAGEIRRDTRICAPDDPRGFDGSSSRVLSQSSLFSKFGIFGL